MGTVRLVRRIPTAITPMSNKWTTVHGRKAPTVDDAPTKEEKAHIKEAMRLSTGGNIMPFKTKDCIRGSKCTTPDCRFVHPGEARMPPPTGRKVGKPCRFGARCYNPYRCKFDHPPSGGAALTANAPDTLDPRVPCKIGKLVRQCDADIAALLPRFSSLALVTSDLLRLQPGEEEDRVRPSTPSRPSASAIKETDTGDTGEAGRQCVICQDGMKTHAIVPCGHKCLCSECAATHANTLSECPMCRGLMTAAIRIYD